tara:strand:- start:1177 stop:1761 length:585 start_codon:yes stop_codon:yes gene_type:complete
MEVPNALYDEGELLSQIAAHNEAAFGKLFHRYHHQLGTFIFNLTKSHELSEEVVQDVFLKIWINRKDLKEINNFKAYLFTVSKNHALNCLKKVARENTLTSIVETDLIPERTDEWPENELYNLLDEAIDHLPPQQKKVYLLSRHERMKYNDIALQLNLSRETVKKYLQLASESITSYIKSRSTNTITLLILYFL